MQGPQYPNRPPPPPPYPQHPFAQYPYNYAQGQYRPPNYVGPVWAQPGPPRKLPDRGAGLGIAFIFISLGVAGLFFLAILIAIVDGGSSRQHHPIVTAGEDSDPRPAPIDMPDGGTGLPAARGLPASDVDKTGEKTWAYSYCEDKPMKGGDVELRENYGGWAMNGGTAKKMRGKVAVVHLLLSSPQLTWTMGKAGDVHRAALLSGRFFEQEAPRYGVSDLDYTPIAWTLPTNFDPPSVVLDSKDRLTNADSRKLVKSALTASEATLGEPMRAVAAQLKSEGYAEVAFLLHVPRVAQAARDFAYPTPLYSDVDVAVVFDERLDRLGYTTAHETMHLFGADDLYPLSRFDSHDAGDVMRASCLGYAGIKVQEMSAYAIGWVQARPDRSYGFDPTRYDDRLKRLNKDN